MRTRILRGLAAITLAGACAAYGFAAHKNHLFPYELGRALYQKRVLRAPPAGWRRPRSRAGSAASPEEINKLASIPYLRGYAAPSDKSGVVVEDRARMQDGWSLYTSGHAPAATLIDSSGRVVKTWTVDAATAFPGVRISKDPEERHLYMNLAHLYPDGGVVAMFSHIGLVRLDLHSRVLWSYPSFFHHDFEVQPDGTIWVLSKENRLVPGFGEGEPVIEDFAEQVSPDGKRLRRISVFEALRQSEYAPLLVHRTVPGPDVLHTNSVRVLDGSLAGRSPAFRRGNLLLSIRHLDLLAVLDPDLGRIVWALSGQWSLQHAARPLGTGRFLLFDNFGSMREASRVLEIDALTQEIAWSWGARPGEDLFSETSGRVERLDNGNTLICETNRGRAVEVTPDGQVVWEWVNPNRAGKQNELVAALYFIQRVPRIPILSGAEPR